MTEADCALLLSCEHGGNLVPDPWRPLFAGHEALLSSHAGYDIGIAGFARWLAGDLHVPLFLAEVTRLLVELNRSVGHPRLYSEISRSLDPETQQQLLDQYYHPYRDAVTRGIEQLLARNDRVCHVSLHSFTPELHGEVRNADIGLLYDPKRLQEKNFCLAWQQALRLNGAGWKVRRNYPYLGTMDGFIPLLRRRFPADRYLGFELEINQRWPLQGGNAWQRLQASVRDTLQATLGARC